MINFSLFVFIIFAVWDSAEQILFGTSDKHVRGKKPRSAQSARARKRRAAARRCCNDIPHNVSIKRKTERRALPSAPFVYGKIRFTDTLSPVSRAP